MRTRRTNRRRFEEPSLVPLADMLTNTVGVLVFILVFTVLTAGGAVIVKRLPMEHESQQRDETYICERNRLYALPDELIEAFVEQLGKPQRSKAGFRDFAAKFNAHRLENADLVLIGEGDVRETLYSAQLELRIRIEPKASGGFTMEELKGEKTTYHDMIQRTDRKQKFFMFLVKPDSISVFVRARDLASAAGLAVGWSPQSAERPIRLSLTGDGRGPKPQ